MNFFTRSLKIVAIASMFLLPQIVCAQPDETTPKAANPTAQDAQKAAVDKAMAEGRETMKKVAQMTPEQIRDFMQETAEKTVRTLLTQTDFNDLELQEIVINYLRQQNLARAQSRFIAARLRDAITDKDTTEAELSQLLSQWQKVSDQEQQRTEDAELELRETLKLDERPRLDAVLHLYGLLGNETWYISNSLAGLSALSLIPTQQEIKQIDAAPAQ